jgi:hypothetical protein
VKKSFTSLFSIGLKRIPEAKFLEGDLVGNGNSSLCSVLFGISFACGIAGTPFGTVNECYTSLLGIRLKAIPETKLLEGNLVGNGNSSLCSVLFGISFACGIAGTPFGTVKKSFTSLLGIGFKRIPEAKFLEGYLVGNGNGGLSTIFLSVSFTGWVTGAPLSTLD